MLNSKGYLSLDGLGTALKTLTLFPWPKRESEDFGSSLIWFPVIGLLLGAHSLRDKPSMGTVALHPMAWSNCPAPVSYGHLPDKGIAS